MFLVSVTAHTTTTPLPPQADAQNVAEAHFSIQSVRLQTLEGSRLVV
jgi:hypothetical protein